MPPISLNQRKATLAYLSLITVFCVLCWSGFLDDLTLEYLDRSLIGSGAIYATARSINALISVLQGTEVSAVFVTFSVGEVLDPVNDLIERFSGLMLLALGSLALQRLLISIVSHDYVTWGLVGLSIIAALLWLRPTVVSRATLLKFAFFLVATRLALPLMTLSIQSVESLFLQTSELEQYESIQNFQSKLEDTNESLGMAASVEEQLRLLQIELGTITATIKTESQKSDALERELAQAQRNADQLERPPSWKPWEENSPELQEADQRVEDLNRQARKQRILVRELKGQAEEIEEAIECIELRSQGKDCGWLDKPKKLVKKADPRPQLQEISERVDDFVTNLVELLISLLFRSVLLPIATLWLFMKFTVRGADILITPSNRTNER